jgi:opacity protein-like surface antigen
MKTHFIFILTLFLALGSALHAQEAKVTAFQRMDRDLLARTQERLDLNDVPCAVVRVSVPDVKSYSFEGNIIGDILYKPGEAIVYMTQGSRNLTIKSDKFGTLRYEFPEKLEKQVVYKMTLKLIQSDANKIRTLVMPVMGFGQATSFGVMIGVVKKSGFYVKAKTNLKSQSTSLECDGNGLDADGVPMWFTNESATSRLALTAGALYRVSLPVYLYGGLGYGYKKLAWETASGEWAENTDKTAKGAEVEVGAIWRSKNFAASAGLQTNSFKYVELTLGVGIMF